MSRRLTFVLAAVAPLVLSAACDRGSRDEPERNAQVNVTEAAPPPPPPVVETAPAVKAPPLTAADKRKLARDSRDGPGEDAAPEYAGARGAATTLPSADGQDDGAKPDATPAPQPPPPSTPQDGGRTQG